MNLALEYRSKLSKGEVHFEHPATMNDRCRDCRYFVPVDHECRIVRGNIEPEDWCSRFEEK